MAKPKNYIISVEVFKYPYCVKSIESIEYEEFLSEKICFYTIKIRKKIVRKTKRVFVYGQLIFSLGNGLAPIQAIGLPILTTTPSIMRSLHLNADLSKQVIIAQVIQEMPAELVFTESEMDELYHLSVGCKNNSLSQEELITKISHLRGGALVDVVAALGVIGAMIILLMNGGSLAFQPNPHVIVPPHLQWLYGNNYKPGQFGYGKGAGPRSITVTGMTQNAGSDKKPPSPGATQSLKTHAQRNAPNLKDRFVKVDGHPELINRRGQCKYKTKDHGALAGLDYRVKKNGGTSTLRTEENVDDFMDVLEKIIRDEDTIWFEKGHYQGNTTREMESLNLYNKKANRILVYQRSTREFHSFCEPTAQEVEALLQTGNFGGGEGWFSGRAKNLTPTTPFDSTNFTPINTFESDVQSITPRDPFSD